MDFETSDCTLVDREHRMVSYLAETLTPAQAEAFESHYFACDQCWRELQQGLEIRAALNSKTDSLVPVLPFVATSETRRSSRRWVPLAAAASLVLVAGLTMWVRGRPSAPVPETTLATTPAPTAPVPATPAPQPAPSPAPQPVITLDELAHVEPAPYLPVELRGLRSDAAARFERAMQRYVEKDFAGAIPELRAAAGLDPKMPKALFFLAVCQLLTHQLGPAIEGLQQTIALGESPYLEEAYFYLAKARLRQDRLRDARDELTRAIEHGGLRERDARQLRTQVEALIRERGK